MKSEEERRQNDAGLTDTTKRGPANPGVKIVAGEKAHIEKAADALDDPTEVDELHRRTDFIQREDQPLKRINDE